MNEVKKLLAKVKMFVDSPNEKASQSLLEALTGHEFSTEIELKKNREFQKFLKESTAQQPELAEINDIVHMSLSFIEKDIDTQRLNDLNSALGKLMRDTCKGSRKMRRVFEDVRMMIENPSQFRKSTLNLEEEVLRLEAELSEYISLPYLNENSDFSIINDAMCVNLLPEKRPVGALKVLAAAPKEYVQSSDADGKNSDVVCDPGFPGSAEVESLMTNASDDYSTSGLESVWGTESECAVTVDSEFKETSDLESVCGTETESVATIDLEFKEISDSESVCRTKLEFAAEEEPEVFEPSKLASAMALRLPTWARPRARPVDQHAMPREIVESKDVPCLIVVRPSDPPAEAADTKKYSQIEALAARFRNNC